jgi:hypothetical protein
MTSKTMHDEGLKGAVEVLHKQHPQKWDDLGPHHETKDHENMSPLGGLKPAGGGGGKDHD